MGTKLKPCYLWHDPRGCHVGRIEEPWKIPDAIHIDKGSQFVLWELGNETSGPKLIELVPPDGDVTRDAILLLKVFHWEKNRYFGMPHATLLGRRKSDPPRVDSRAKFTVFANERNFGLTVQNAEQPRSRG